MLTEVSDELAAPVIRMINVERSSVTAVIIYRLRFQVLT
jgi:hypothetical protein